MRTKEYNISAVPAVLYGEPSERVWLFLHGQNGCKEEAAEFAALACPRGDQVLSIDLPGHGSRRWKGETLDPWAVTPELRLVADYIHGRWNRLAIRANSIGAYFAMLSIPAPERALLVSPILDMERLILDMMRWAGVTEDQLRDQREIPTAFGQTLSWDYLCYVREHPIHSWRCPIQILWAGRDNMTGRETVEQFVRRQGAHLTVYEEGEHWFHTPEQLTVLRSWEEANL